MTSHCVMRGATGRTLDWLAIIFGIVTIAGPLANAGSSVSATTPNPGVVGVTAGHGRFLVAGTSTEFLPRGFTSVGVLYPTEYANWMCTQKNNNPSSIQGRDLMAAQRRMTTMTNWELSQGMITHWYANAVRFQISQGALHHEYKNGLSAYTDMVLRPN